MQVHARSRCRGVRANRLAPFAFRRPRQPHRRPLPLRVDEELLRFLDDRRRLGLSLDAALKRFEQSKPNPGNEGWLDRSAVHPRPHVRLDERASNFGDAERIAKMLCLLCRVFFAQARGDSALTVVAAERDPRVYLKVS